MSFTISKNPHREINLLTAPYSELLKTAEDLSKANRLSKALDMHHRIEQILYSSGIKHTEDREKEYIGISKELDRYKESFMNFTISNSPHREINLLTASHKALLKAAEDLFKAKDLSKVSDMHRRIEKILYRSGIEHAKDRDREYANTHLTLAGYEKKLEEIIAFDELPILYKIAHVFDKATWFLDPPKETPLYSGDKVVEIHHHHYFL